MKLVLQPGVSYQGFGLSSLSHTLKPESIRPLLSEGEREEFWRGGEREGSPHRGRNLKGCQLDSTS